MQSFVFDAATQLIVFAVNAYDRWSSFSSNEFDIDIDVNGDGTIDYTVIGVDDGAVNTGSFNGRMRTFVLDRRTGGLTSVSFATAPTDSSTALLVLLSWQLCLPGSHCLNASNPRFAYSAIGFDILNGGDKAVPSRGGVLAGKMPPGAARFNAWSNAISFSNDGFAVVEPGASDSSVVVSVNEAEAALTPPKGVMVVTFDNHSGAEEAQLIEVEIRR